MATRQSEARTPTPRKKQQRTVETRLKIIKAAMSEFALLGFEGATTRGIAEAADAPHSLVLYHFKGKEELWYETVREAVRWYARQGLEGVTPTDDRNPVDQLKGIFSHYIRFSAEHPDFFRMLTHENKLTSERLSWHVKTHLAPIVARTTGLISKAQNAGAFVEGDPTTLLYLFLGSATAPYRSAREIELVTGKSPYSPKAIERHIVLCERMFFRTPTAP